MMEFSKPHTHRMLPFRKQQEGTREKHRCADCEAVRVRCGKCNAYCVTLFGLGNCSACANSKGHNVMHDFTLDEKYYELKGETDDMKTEERNEQIAKIHERLSALEQQGKAGLYGADLNEIRQQISDYRDNVELAHNRIDIYANENASNRIDELATCVSHRDELIEKLVESAKNVESNFAILEKRADAICEDIERLKDWQLNGKEVLNILQSLQAEIGQMKGRRFEDEPTAFDALQQRSKIIADAHDAVTANFTDIEAAERKAKFDAGLEKALEKLPPVQIAVLDTREGAETEFYDLGDLLVGYCKGLDSESRQAVLTFLQWIRKGAYETTSLPGGIAPKEGVTLTAPSGTILKSNCEPVKVETTETRIKRIADLEQVLSGMVNNCYGRGTNIEFNIALEKARKLLGEA